ncbi:MAG TPA: nucleotide disphospho-sugar-binding domain-containing protein [Rhodopila sp.]|nr:nucleotide disphospho-sugar-binding domain-containing protein [Rhodopila sp.]
MARFLIAGTPVPGHIAPLLAVARHLHGRGHEVVLYTASVFRDQVQAAGAHFVSFPAEIDLDYRRLDEHFPERAALPPGPAQLIFGLKHLFADAMPQQCHGIREILAWFPAEAIIIDTMFCGVMPLVLAGRHRRPPVVSLGITALAWSSEDTAFFGTALPPPTTPPARARATAMTRYMQQNFYGEVQSYFDAILAKQGLPALPNFLFNSFITMPDVYLQLTAKGFEYPRRDLPNTVRFVGPLLPPPSTRFDPPEWWDDLDGDRPVVLVTQGTLANTDLGQLVGPTLTALARDDVLVVATTGGPPVEAIPVPLPANARAGVFVPFDRLLPKVDLMVTNGGYGAVNHALSLGVPLVVAGDSEEKPEIAARVAWAGAGINLETGRPSPEHIQDAVQAVLADPCYRKAARDLQAEFARYHALEDITAVVEGFIGATA